MGINNKLVLDNVINLIVPKVMKKRGIVKLWLPEAVTLLYSFHLNGHTSGFHPETQKLEPPCTA